MNYLDGKQRCDLFIEYDELRLPVEAKLLRFRYDNGNIDPNSFARIFRPFPEHSSSSLLTDTKKLHESEFGSQGGVLGLYYKAVDEEYERMSAEAVAEKFCRDVDHWYDFQVETRAIASFDGLQHPVHQQGAVITWEIVSYSVEGADWYSMPKIGLVSCTKTKLEEPAPPGELYEPSTLFSKASQYCGQEHDD